MIHEIVTNDMFLFISGICSVIGLVLSLFATIKVIKINNSMNIKSQNITANNNSNAAGRDVR
ncbi:hypothetical protein [Campylobacter pinnipediorum]|uniref:Uncharacterized protein n=1 Tax=Campylobacter pinnipediorum subsp. pinnipediorum TaxID=1660067 RepID=A0AAX0L9S8_9BACT|nr:hypothetical protein [Campylobacter pinnipediorum]AQW81265.1 hypothetical protein CPIN17260_0968 [Campylobacter pinnipediorum subsp. pinnipediorum]AQW82886.1 hypothetical protein CPIN17261_0876 [Campylobacter pinnipediorum subsp. pinnipediorum]OPA77228.1 hypothetical protein BFG04_03795 [Campylobacter pinnipediorum subsp. pinnipediorum]